MSAYAEASKAVFAVFEDVTPMVEPLSIDEAFLDVRGLRHLRPSPVEIARSLRARVRDEVGLPITVGVAGTKFLAKVASAVGKPDGLLVVPLGRELEFLHPLPVQRLWGVGKVTAEKLHARGIYTVAEVADLAAPSLVSMLGPAAGHHLHALAHNLDPRPVVTGRRRRSIGSQSALGTRHRLSPAELDARLLSLVERVCRRLRGAHRLCRTVVLRLRFDDFSRVTRSHTLPRPTDRTADVLATARSLLHGAAPLVRSRGLTLVGVAVANLDDDGVRQLVLPLRRGPSAVRGPEALDAAVDAVRSRFGSSALSRAVVLGRGDDRTVPLLPD
jgi:DNA polymerase-4